MLIFVLGVMHHVLYNMRVYFWLFTRCLATKSSCQQLRATNFLKILYSVASIGFTITGGNEAQHRYLFTCTPTLILPFHEVINVFLPLELNGKIKQRASHVFHPEIGEDVNCF